MGAAPRTIQEQLQDIDDAGPRAATDPGARALLVAGLADTAAIVRARAAERLAAAGVSAVPVLVTTLQSGAPPARAAAAYGLGAMGAGARDGLGPLRTALGSADDATANMADWALSRVLAGAVDSVAEALRKLRYGTPDDQVLAANWLGGAGPDAIAAVPLLVRCLGGSDPGVVNASADALVQVGAPAIPSVYLALTDPDIDRRVNAWAVWTRLQPSGHL